MPVPTTSPSSQSAGDTHLTEGGSPNDRRGAPGTGMGMGMWVLLVSGIGSILYGLLVMSLRPSALVSIAIFAGVSFLVGGAAQFLLARNLVGGWRALAYVAGALGLVAGIAAFVWPAMTIAVLAIFTAWSLTVSGILRLVGTFAGHRKELWWVGLIAGVVELALGLWAIGSPDRIVLLFINLVGLWLVVVGVDCIVAAFSSRGEGLGPTAPLD